MIIDIDKSTRGELTPMDCVIINGRGTDCLSEAVAPRLFSVLDVSGLQELVAIERLHLVDVLLDFLFLLQWDDEQRVVHVGNDVALEP